MHFVPCDVNGDSKQWFCKMEDNFDTESRQLSWLECQSVAWAQLPLHEQVYGRGDTKRPAAVTLSGESTTSIRYR